MRRVLIALLIVCNLVSGVEISSDMDSLWGDHGSPVSGDYAAGASFDQSDDHEGDESVCDHCCHASAHTLAFPVSQCEMGYQLAALDARFLSNARSRAGTQPPVPPPIV